MKHNVNSWRLNNQSTYLFISIYLQIHKTLEMRLAAAEDVIKSVQQEKVEKENSARKALSNQELLMETVVQESKILKQQAEQNAKVVVASVSYADLNFNGYHSVPICQEKKLIDYF